MIGTDIIETNRIKSAAQRLGDRFMNRIFTDKEISYCKSRGVGFYASLAARFSAKEAVSKIFGTGIRDISWKEIEVLNDTHGKPHVMLSGKALALSKKLKFKHIHISLSHNKNYATAVAYGEQ